MGDRGAGRALVASFALALGVATAAIAAAAPLPVLVTMPPHADLVARLGGELVDVRVLVAPGQSPHTYDPTPRELVRLTASRVWLRTGLAMEDGLADRLAGIAPRMAVVDLRQGLDLLEATRHDHHDGDHAGAGHEAEGLDAHIWLSPRLLATQAATAAAALAAADPPRAAQYAANLAAVQDSLAALDRELTALLAPYRGRAFAVFHPAFGYFARDYGLAQVAIEAGGVEPSPRHLAEVLGALRREGTRVVYLQPQYAGAAARALAAEAELRVGQLDPNAHDLFANLRRIGRTLAADLGGGAP